MAKERPATIDTMAMASPDFMLTGDAARRLALSAERVRQLERAGLLRAVKTVGGVRLYRREAVEALAAQRQRR
jgi:excisionase family DNA binding protein